jgi:uncharacterized membrane protein
MDDLGYSLIKYVHVICAIIWLGGAFFAQLLAVRAQRSTDPTDLPKYGQTIGELGMKVFLPASILLFIAGLILVIQRWSFSSVWVSVSIVLWLASVLVGALYLGPTGAKLGKVFAAEGPTSVAGRAGLERILLISRIELVSFAIIVFMMVVKPGA